MAAALIVPAAVLAQQAPDPSTSPAAGQQWQREHHGGGMMRMFRDLNLSDQQKTQIQQIMQQYRQAHPRGSAPDPQARKQMRDQIMNVLTPQQRTQLQQEMQRFRQEHEGEGGAPATPQP
jgi:Spy/CpxP family protein refolding chaperone